LNETARINELKKQTRVLFGTDSTLTASWNLWDHLRLARETKLVTDAELFDMLTINPAKTWHLNATGELAEGQWADITVAKAAGSSEKWDQFYKLDPGNLLLILHRGNVRLFDEELLDPIKTTNIQIGKFSKVYVDGIGKYVWGDLPGLIKEILKYNPNIRFPVTCD